MTTHSDDGPDLEHDDDLLAFLLRPAPEHLGPPSGRYEAIRRTAARRRMLRAAAGVGASCAVAALIALPVHLLTAPPATPSPAIPLAPPSASAPPAMPTPSASPSRASSGTPEPSTAPSTAPRTQRPSSAGTTRDVQPSASESSAPDTSVGTPSATAG
ncbi:hypothetical protein OG607_31810 [Streptomyces sp. NBC_01537]|uniref:hypothetical protein n=1 Tax=Streptomyces sp. NBC_01537 TaxID=2903896 RepID=UPI003864041D